MKVKHSQRKIAVLLILSVLCSLLCTATAATMGERNALQSANNYLSFMHFSYDGLIGQLEYEGYSESECRYAADNCGADWYDQAAGSAENYMSFMSFSKSGLINQLEYEGFTHEQAEYGAAVAYGENPVKPGTRAKSNSSRNETSSSTVNTTAAAASPDSTQNTNTKSDIPRTDNGFDLSGLSYEDLITLQSQVSIELGKYDRSDEKAVKVPTGTYEVGVDIPAGKWTITATDGMCEVYWGKKLDEYGVDIPYSDRIDKLDDWGNKSSVTWNLTEGTYIVVNRNAVTFTPYKPVALGF